MNLGIQTYLNDFVTRLGQGWNRFWFTPSDPRALCALRFCVGALAVAWFYKVGSGLEYLFGTNGLLPQSAGFESPNMWRFSILDFANNSSSFTIIYWGGLAVLVAFMLGFLSRITNILSLGLVLSVLHYKSVLIEPFEVILVPALLYLCFAPTGAIWSIDALLWRKQGSPLSKGYMTTIATRLLQIHFVAMYAIIALSELRVTMWWEGSAVWWMTSKADTRLADFSELPVYLLNAWTHAIVLFEGAFAVLIFNSLARPLMLALSVVMWAGFAVISGQVLFSLLMIAAGLAFVSPTWLQSLSSPSAAVRA